MKRSTVLLLPLLALPVHSQPPSAAPTADPKATALLMENAEAMFALKSYAETCWSTLTYQPAVRRPQGGVTYTTATLTAVKPNRIRYDSWIMQKEGEKLTKKSDAPFSIITSDGVVGVTQYKDIYRPIPKITPESLDSFLEPCHGFYAKATSYSGRFQLELQGNTLKMLHAAGQESCEGVTCDVVEYEYVDVFGNGNQEHKGKLYLGADKLLRRKVEQVTFNGKEDYTKDSIIRNIRTNFPDPEAKLFIYTPSADVKSVAEAEKLLAKGTVAPDFMVNDLEGKPVKLSDFRGKVVVLDFWATWCVPCLASMPETNAIAAKYKDRGVVVLGINVWDEAKAFKSWVPQHPEFGAIQFLLDPNGNNKQDIARNLYKVYAIPTQYVIDKKGIVQTAFLGAPPKGELEKRLEEIL